MNNQIKNLMMISCLLLIASISVAQIDRDDYERAKRSADSYLRAVHGPNYQNDQIRESMIRKNYYGSGLEKQEISQMLQATKDARALSRVAARQGLTVDFNPGESHNSTAIGNSIPLVSSAYTIDKMNQNVINNIVDYVGNNRTKMLALMNHSEGTFNTKLPTPDEFKLFLKNKMAKLELNKDSYNSFFGKITEFSKASEAVESHSSSFAGNSYLERIRSALSLGSNLKFKSSEASLEARLKALVPKTSSRGKVLLGSMFFAAVAGAQAADITESEVSLASNTAKTGINLKAQDWARPATVGQLK